MLFVGFHHAGDPETLEDVVDGGNLGVLDAELLGQSAALLAGFVDEEVERVEAVPGLHTDAFHFIN